MAARSSVTFNPWISTTVVVMLATYATMPSWATRSVRFTNATTSMPKFRLLSLLPNESIYSSDMKYILPSEDYIAYTLSKYKFSERFTLEITFEPSTCSNLAAIPAMQYYYDKKVDGFLGLPCPESCSQVVQYSSAIWNIPVVSIGAVESDFRDPTKISYKHSIFVRLSFDGGALSRSIIQNIFLRNNWNKFFSMYSTVSGYAKNGCTLMINDLYKEWQALDKHAEFMETTNKTFEDSDLDFAFKSRIGTDFAVVVLCADPDTVREIMIKAQELGFINGEYVFFNIDLFSSEKLTLQPWHRDNDTQERNEKAAKAYRALMTITLRKPNSPEYRNFSQQVKEIALNKYKFNYPEEEVNSFVGAFHDAVLLYALAINDTLKEHGIDKISNGSLITEKMKNRTFEGITGTVSININGDRDADYSLLDMDKNTKNFTVVAHYYGNRQKYELVPGKEIDWYNEKNQPPPDVPLCGFDYSRCKKDFSQVAVYAVIVLLVLICVLAVVIVVIYRKLRLESELHAMNWRIPWCELEPMDRYAAARHDSEVQDREHQQHQHCHQHHHRGEKRTDSVRLIFGNSHGSKKVSRGCEKKPLNDNQPVSGLVKRGTSSQMDKAASMDSVDTIAGVPLSQIPATQLFAKTAYYKGALVALKPLCLRNKRIEVTNRLLMEVKRVKDLTSDNVIRFIGACLDPPNECLVSEYCPKGSLQDILENDNLNLDWMFKFSLMLDICRGMIYLHHNFGSHGNLKSSNCLVDSRFSLKIADFGLHSLRGPKEYKDKEDAEYSSYRRQFYERYCGRF